MAPTAAPTKAPTKAPTQRRRPPPPTAAAVADAPPQIQLTPALAPQVAPGALLDLSLGLEIMQQHRSNNIHILLPFVVSQRPSTTVGGRCRRPSWLRGLRPRSRCWRRFDGGWRSAAEPGKDHEPGRTRHAALATRDADYWYRALVSCAALSVILHCVGGFAGHRFFLIERFCSST